MCPSTTESSISDDQQSVDDASTAIHALNEECAIGDWAVIATNAEIVDTVEENDYYGFTADDGNKYLMKRADRRRLRPYPSNLVGIM